MQVLELTNSHKPITPDTTSGLRWTCRIRTGNQDGGYNRAKAVLDELRRHGCPNWIPDELADDDLARLGRVVLSGKPLPRQAAARNIDRERCRRAMQGHLFNRWLMARVQDGLLGRCVIGDRLRGRTGEEELVTDPTHAGKRLESWEAVVLGPMFGAGLSPVGGEAERREAELLAAADLTMDHLASLDGHRRAARIQPLKALIDVKSIDLVLTCELPVESSIDAILREIIKDDAKPATADLTQDAEA